MSYNPELKQLAANLVEMNKKFSILEHSRKNLPKEQSTKVQQAIDFLGKMILIVKLID